VIETLLVAAAVAAGLVGAGVVAWYLAGRGR
jgi:hypothetical protein